MGLTCRAQIRIFRFVRLERGEHGSGSIDVERGRLVDLAVVLHEAGDRPGDLGRQRDVKNHDRFAWHGKKVSESMPRSEVRMSSSQTRLYNSYIYHDMSFSWRHC